MKGRIDVRITDIPKPIFVLIKADADKETRSIQKQILHIIKAYYSAK